ncbi:porin [Cupriavidus necator]
MGYTGGDFMGRVAYADAKDGYGPGRMPREYFIGAKYNFGMATGYVNYVIKRGAIVPGTPNYKSEDVLVGEMAPVGARRVILSYIHKNDRTAANSDIQQATIGYVHREYGYQRLLPRVECERCRQPRRRQFSIQCRHQLHFLTTTRRAGPRRLPDAAENSHRIYFMDGARTVSVLRRSPSPHKHRHPIHNQPDLPPPCMN